MNIDEHLVKNQWLKNIVYCRWLPIPDPDELSQDIEMLETLRVAVDMRNKQGIPAKKHPASSVGEGVRNVV